jgi:hypothetical protein
MVRNDRHIADLRGAMAAPCCFISLRWIDALATQGHFPYKVIFRPGAGLQKP